MAKIVAVCVRDRSRTEEMKKRLLAFLEGLKPDNLETVQIEIRDDGAGYLIGVLNPVEPIIHYGAYAGWMAEQSQWWQPGTSIPDGTFALFRGDADRIELIADYAGSRTIWTAHDDSIFVASTSQLAIPWFLGKSSLNLQAVSWMLSSGSTGPGYGWDTRAKAIAPAGRLSFYRHQWKAQTADIGVEFTIDRSPDRIHRDRLRKALQGQCSELNVDWSRWALPLSGGVDSRVIATQIRQSGVRSITWGLKRDLETPQTDGYVARELAKHLGFSFQYFQTDLSDEPAEKLFNRFIAAGDGRVDHIAGYMDGFAVWKKLREDGIEGVVRGDQPFGRHFVARPSDVMPDNSLARWSDFTNVPPLKALDCEHLESVLPHHFERRAEESIADWRDRLVHLHQIPAVLASLTELKSAYVETANPLLIKTFVQLSRSQPEHLRTEKRILRDLVSNQNIPFSRDVSSEYAHDVLGMPNVREMLMDELKSQRVREIFSELFVDFLSSRFHAAAPAVTNSPSLLRRIARRAIPKSIKARLVRPVRHIRAAQIALRVYIASAMAERISTAARSGAKLAA